MRLRPFPVAAIVLALSAAGCQVLDKLTESGSLAIHRFTATPAEVSAGGATSLSWDVDGAETIEIDNGVGTVSATGSRQVRPSVTTTYRMTARAGTSMATASVQVAIVAATPSPSPSPVPSPSASPTPSPSPSPAPSPSPSPSPTASCGAPVASVSGCSVTVLKRDLPSGQCTELTALTANQSCPVGVGTVRSLSFDVTARTPRSTLAWRRHAQSADVLTPASGTLAGAGRTSVIVSDIVLDGTVTFEVVDGDSVLMTFTLRHY